MLASLNDDAHFDDNAKRDKPVPTKVDALLAKVTALKEARGESGEASEVHGTDPQFRETRGGESQRQEKETWSDPTSITLDQIEE